MITFDATYDPADDKLRLRASSRLDAETYSRVKAAGFGWAPRQGLLFAVWAPAREDLLAELAGDIGDEETSPADRAAQRAERFEGYQGNRAADAEQARKSVSAIADGIPLGQPILVGHHSERHARKDAEKIENGMRRAVKMWETSQYWRDRAAGAIRHAKQKELPAVRARRIKTLVPLRVLARRSDMVGQGAIGPRRVWRWPDSREGQGRSGRGAQGHGRLPEGYRREQEGGRVRPVGGSMEDQEGQEGIADDKAASELAWFAVKVAAAGLAVNYALGPVVVIVFLAGWLWGTRNIEEEGKP